MTYKAVLDAFRKIYDSMNVKGFEIQNAFHTIDEVIWEWKKYKDRAEKYKWHDLRKDPEDLPREDGLYCIAIEWADEIETGFGQWENMYGYRSGWSALMPSLQAVIAWKEIEPFEVEE